MEWIDVNERLPPNNINVLINKYDPREKVKMNSSFYRLLLSLVNWRARSLKRRAKPRGLALKKQVRSMSTCITYTNTVGFF